MTPLIQNAALLGALISGLASPLFAEPPDLTKDLQSVDRKLTYYIGATGLRGWIHTRMAGLKALTKYHFNEGMAATVGLAKSQGGHGSETRTGEIMKLIVGYGAAAKPQIPAMKEIT